MSNYSNRVTSTDSMTPGMCYALFEHEQGDVEPLTAVTRTVALVYYTGPLDGLVHDIDDEPCNDVWDYAIAQSDKPNPEYVWSSR